MAAAIEAGHVGFDVQKRGVIENINICKVQNGPFASDQSHQAQPDRVGASRGPSGENAAFRVMEKRLHHQAWRTGPVKPVEQPDMGEALQIRQPRSVLRQHLGPPWNALREYRLNGRVLCPEVRAANHPNGIQAKETGWIDLIRH